jgi:molybdate transport system substrate-binding protein
MFKKIVILIVFFSFTLDADSLKVASVAGYKKPMMKIANGYEKSGKSVDMMFGNMRKTISQAKYSDICLVVGDKEYLTTKSDLDINKMHKLGNGKLVLAFRKGLSLKNIDDLKDKIIKRVAMPHSKKAIYGKATKEFLEHFKHKDALKKKLLEVATVPQVATYIISKEVDAGFMNITAAINHKNKIGGYILIDKELYSPIGIVAATLNRENCEDVNSFVEFLNTDFSKNILKQSGL